MPRAGLWQAITDTGRTDLPKDARLDRPQKPTERIITRCTMLTGKYLAYNRQCGDPKGLDIPPVVCAYHHPAERDQHHLGHAVQDLASFPALLYGAQAIRLKNFVR